MTRLMQEHAVEVITTWLRTISILIVDINVDICFIQVTKKISIGIALCYVSVANVDTINIRLPVSGGITRCG